MIIGNTSKRTVVFAWEDKGYFMMSKFIKAIHGRRPIALFDTREELEAEATRRGIEIQWLV